MGWYGVFVSCLILSSLDTSFIVFQMLQRAKKCVIGSNTIDFVGHQIGQSVIALHEGNVIMYVIRDAPRP